LKIYPDGKFVSIHKEVYKESTEDLDYLRELVEAGHIRPVIDRTFPLDEIVEAYRSVEQGLKVGNVVVTVEHNNT
jgi:NADPH:quinone reductase-like Zn-dependent oxidoreductase